MDFFFLPILFGCSTRVQPEGDQIARVCPRCNNAAMIQARSRQWFELFCVPVVPMSSKHIWICNMCHFQARQQPGQWEPTLPGSNFRPGGGFGPQPGPPPNAWFGSGPPGAQPGSQPGYPGYRPGYQPAYQQ